MPKGHPAPFCLVLVALSAACDEDDDSSFPIDAGDEAMPGFGDGRFGDDDDAPGGPGSSSNEPEPQGPVDALPDPIPVDPPSTTNCGELTCRDVLVGDIVVPPCCPEGPGLSCGLELDPVTSFMPLASGCVSLEQPGNRDTACPDIFFNDPVELRDLPGCCMPEGTCGVIANLSLLADFGCVDPRALLLGASDDELQRCTPDLPEPDPEPAVEPDEDAGASSVDSDAGTPGERDAGAGRRDAGQPTSPVDGPDDAAASTAEPDAADPDAALDGGP